MARHRRQRAEAPTAGYTDPEAGELTLRGALSPGTRRQYAQIASSVREDAWQRQVEFLFERLAVCWEVNGVPAQGQKELLGRLRVASQPERAFVRRALRAHCEAHFPDVAAP